MDLLSYAKSIHPIHGGLVDPKLGASNHLGLSRFTAFGSDTTMLHEDKNDKNSREFFCEVIGYT